jgi:eukaryotic-like serine/threonine-protein kinase
MVVDKEDAAEWTAGIAVTEAKVGNADKARKAADEALQLTTGKDARLAAALALALAGDRTKAREIADELANEFPLDTLAQCCSLPAIRAAIALDERDPEKAIKILESARPYEMSTLAVDAEYVRGLAYLQEGEPQQAAEEFQKMIDRPGLVLENVIWPLAHLQLGRAQVMMGDTAAARKSYQGFLTLWKDADPDIPIYRQAKAEYAKLK